DVSWSPGQDVPLHVHTRDTVAVFVDGGTIRQREPDGSEDTTTYASEDVVFISAGTTHASSVTSGSPRVMFYELKD
ncbi:MAG: cupin domain-containing protein, partial [Vicinamibacterales bacterium]|nr:cupin domain-containing protein [Vicinamibacterales bacterium]